MGLLLSRGAGSLGQAALAGSCPDSASPLHVTRAKSIPAVTYRWASVKWVFPSCALLELRGTLPKF